MKIIFILNFLILIYQFFSLDYLNLNSFINDNEIGRNALLIPIIQSFLSTNTISINNLSLSENCKIKETYFSQKIDDISLSYYSKLIFTSSKNKNDLGSPENCENDKNLKNLNYISVLIENENSYYEELKNNNSNLAYYFFGICIIDGCEKDDYIKIINSTLSNINQNKTEKNESIDKGKISIYYMKNKNKEDKIYIKILKYIPLIFISIQIIFSIFNNIPLFLYNLFICLFCCERKNKKKKGNTKIRRILSKDKGQLIPKNENYSINSLSTSTVTISSNIDKINEMLNLLYNVDKNFEVLLECKKQNENFNESGLSYINGLKGISMIFLLFGNVFIAIYNSPIIEQNPNNLYEILKNFFYFIYYFGIKYAPKLLICCSGFSLFYKFACFLDDKVETEKDIIKQRDESRAKSEDSNRKNDDDINSNKKNKNNKSTGNKTFHFSSLVLIKSLFIFIGYQLHKYILYILMITFFLFSFYGSISFLHGPGPVWDFFNQKMIEPSYQIKHIIPLLFGFQGYLLSFIRNDKFSILNYFNLVYQEIFYFIISSIILFFGYKKNLRIDFYIIILIVLLFSFRIIYYFMDKTNSRDYFSFHSFGQFFTSLVYNYIYYLFGIFFGMFNYVIQKRYSILDCKKNKKIYLINCVKIIERIKERKIIPVIIIVIIILFILFNIFIQQILLFYFQINNSMKECMKNYDNNSLTEIFLLIDSDLIILLINIMAIFLYLKGNNILNDFINHNFWSVLNRFYFSYILLINPIILYVLYISETKINFNMNNCIIYSFICGILVFTITTIIYIFFELPFKKAIRYWFKLSEKEINDERLINIENNFNYSQIENQSDLLEDTISDEEEYEVEEEEED